MERAWRFQSTKDMSSSRTTTKEQLKPLLPLKPRETTIPKSVPETVRTSSHEAQKPTEVPRDARIAACFSCRKRKVKCDRNQPGCGACKRSAHPCWYDKQRKKTGWKKPSVKMLAARLESLETILRTDKQPEREGHPRESSGRLRDTGSFSSDQAFGPSSHSLDKDRIILTADSSISTSFAAAYNRTEQVSSTSLCSLQNINPIDDLLLGSTSCQGADSSLEEPLPDQSTVDALHKIYFKTVHPTCPIIHPARYLAACDRIDSKRPSTALR